MVTTFINSDLLLKHLREQLNAQMAAAAEPLIKEAVEKIEREMRVNLASNLISLIEGQVHLYDNTSHLAIHINKER